MDAHTVEIGNSGYGCRVEREKVVRRMWRFRDMGLMVGYRKNQR